MHESGSMSMELLCLLLYDLQAISVAFPIEEHTTTHIHITLEIILQSATFEQQYQQVHPSNEDVQQMPKFFEIEE
jgi:hypothetical protein